MGLGGKVALVSGAARGTGATESALFAVEGLAVVVADIQTEPGEQVATDLSRNGGTALFVELDVTRESSWQRAVEERVDRFGRLGLFGADGPGRMTRAGVSGQFRSNSVRVLPTECAM